MASARDRLTSEEMEMDMVERVARVLDPNAWCGDPDADYPLAHRRIADRKEESLGKARAAIAAMREPTEAMKHATDEVHWGYSCAVCGGLTEGWYAMIDAALADPA